MQSSSEVTMLAATPRGGGRPCSPGARGERAWRSLLVAIAMSSACSRSSSAPGAGSGVGSSSAGNAGSAVGSSSASNAGSAVGSSSAAEATAVPPPKRPGTCEAALDRYTELFVDVGPPADRARRALTMDHKRAAFLEDCGRRVAAGQITAAQLECAANAASLTAGALCLPPRP